MDNIELEKLHNKLIKEQFDLLFINGIYESSDNAYKKLPINLQEKYLDIWSKIDWVHNKMIGKFLTVIAG